MLLISYVKCVTKRLNNFNSSPAVIKEVESKSTSMITSESGEQQHQKLLSVSSQTFSRTSGLLSSLKVVTLRKSCVTRQAFRVEIVGGRQLEGHKSSSGKSSVGSSSHPSYDFKNTTLRASLNKVVTPDNNRNAMRAPQENCDKVRKSNMSKESTAKTQDLTFKSGCGSKTNAVAKSTHLETVKSKQTRLTKLCILKPRGYIETQHQSWRHGSAGSDSDKAKKCCSKADAEKNGESNSFPHKSPKILGRMNMVSVGQRFSMGKEDPEIAKNRDTVVAPPRKSVVEPVDQWAFLLFHQSSSQLLISAFSCVGEGNTNKTSSPKHPRSVPRSSGKNYKIKDWGQSNCCGVASNKHHLIKNLFIKSSRLNSICSYPNPSSNFGNSKTDSSPAAIKGVESKSASTITSESGEQQHRKLLNVSSQIVSCTSGLLSSEMDSSNIKRRREKLLKEARESVPEPGSGRVMHLVKAFEKLLTITKDSDQMDEKQSEDVGDDDDNDKKGMKWALPGLHGRTFGGGHRSRRNSSESSGTFSGSCWKKKQLKATYQKLFKLRTKQRGRYKEEESVKKLQQMMMEEEKQRIPIAQGLPWIVDEPECLIKPAVKEITRPVDLVLHSDVRAMECAEFDQQVAEKMSLIEQYKDDKERQQKLYDRKNLMGLVEEEEIRKLRKELTPRAQPMPYFDKPFIPRRLMKHCTIPREPTFHIPPQHKKIKCGIVIAAFGAVKHEDIVVQVKKLFTKLSTDPTTASELVAKEPAIFTGSTVRIIDDDIPLAQFAVAFNGASWTDPDSIALMVMQSMLGSWNKNAGGGKHMGFSELAQRVGIDEIAKNMMAFNTNYKDTGLFGVYAIAKPDCLDDLAYAIMYEMSTLYGTCPVAEDIGCQLLTYGRRIPFTELFARIDVVDASTVKCEANHFIFDQDVTITAMGHIQGLPDYNWFRRRTYWLRY
ncbi:unnamed protein product [Camellia sinensis]